MPKTIRELAEELGVSKQRIQQVIAKLSPSEMPNKEGNRYVLNSKDVHNIKSSMGLSTSNPVTSKTEHRVVDYDVYLDVINSLKEKDEQIRGLLEAQKQTQSLLNQQQRLALKDKNMLEEYKSEIKGLETLNMPSQNIKQEASTQHNADVEDIQERPHSKNKKWWQIW